MLWQPDGTDVSRETLPSARPAAWRAGTGIGRFWADFALYEESYGDAMDEVTTWDGFRSHRPCDAAR